jgi:hypothetical protein
LPAVIVSSPPAPGSTDIIWLTLPFAKEIHPLAPKTKFEPFPAVMVLEPKPPKT